MNSNSENSTFIGILIPVRALQVSYASNLLRVIQAAIRELAQSSSQTNQLLSERPPPVLSSIITFSDDESVIKLFFTRSDLQHDLPILTEEIGKMFLNSFREFLSGNSQSSLFGFNVPESRSQQDSSLHKRYSQVSGLLKRYPGTSLSHAGVSIKFTEDGFGVY